MSMRNNKENLTSLNTILSNTTETFKNNEMQIAVFKTNCPNHYGINVNKVKAFIRTQDCNISISLNDSTIEGYVVIRDQTLPLLNLDKWLNNPILPTKEYKYIILTEFNQQHMAFLATDIVKIYNKTSQELEKPPVCEDKITYIAHIDIGGKDELCLILDVESYIANVLGADNEKLKEIEHIAPKTYTKEVLIAEDSKSAKRIISSIMGKTGVKFTVYSDGQELIDALEKRTDYSSIGVVISDIEMPVKDGFQVAQYVTKLKLPVYLNTSMSNEGVKAKAESMGAGFIRKTTPTEIIEVINKYCI